MGAIVLPFMWLGMLLTGVATVGVIGLTWYLFKEGYTLGAILFDGVIAFILFACWYWGA